MATPAVSRLHATRGRRVARSKIIPFYACPGMAEQPLGYAVFPYGDGFSKPNPCPARAVCLWFYWHDLGGKTAFNELPKGMQLSPRFRSHPFSCALFQEDVATLHSHGGAGR